ncbi:Apq12p [Lachancea thermotolerans CBS 6340]|uniref:KLTH0A03762p n=1 Tax=Lachancea thermotolerans (strain ATCC 56472 / CBS 6340 / NRRL Y-8284) TaxID=559295 RepID=C5DBM3_LACTC|nr:KLTH0A03762p [Lachancea thermotolerans CBS 6340]CAR21180.1 KLTH0A03762p [Lachancea thermotolerans CBS 6340]
MEPKYEQVQAAISWFASYVLRTLAWILPLTYRFAQSHPTITNILGYMLSAYILWKVVCHLWAIIKKLLLVAAVLFSVLLWYRGLHQVLSVDAPILLEYLRNDSYLRDRWSQAVRAMNPTYLGIYSPFLLGQHLQELRNRSLRFLASASN